MWVMIEFINTLLIVILITLSNLKVGVGEGETKESNNKTPSSTENWSGPGISSTIIIIFYY